MQSVCIFLFLFVGCLLGTSTTSPVVPTDGQVFTSSVTLKTGTYHLAKGILIGAPNIHINLNGATLVGTAMSGYGITAHAQSGFTIANGTVMGYFYGLYITDAHSVTINDMELSHNYLDPRSTTPHPPMLNIHVSPADVDKTNFGGGMYLESVYQSTFSRITAQHNVNGIDAYFLFESTIQHSDLSFNTAWGIHLYKGGFNKVSNNKINNCTRAGLMDSSNILLACGSHGNTFTDNMLRGGGDGVYLAWTPVQPDPICCQNNNNNFLRNDVSGAGANGFESDFSLGCIFENNTANDCNFGFWLGYSRLNTIVRHNKISGNKYAGIAVDHGQDFQIHSNHFENNAADLMLWSDNKDHYPTAKFTCLAGYDHKRSTNYTVFNNHFLSKTTFSLTNTTHSLFYNNYVAKSAVTQQGDSSGTQWNLPAPTTSHGKSIIGLPYQGGNFWEAYTGCTDPKGADYGIGETPFKGNLEGMDALPLTKKPCAGN